MSAISTKSEVIVVSQRRFRGRRMWVAAAIVAAVAGGVTVGMVGTLGNSSPTPTTVRPLTSAEREIQRSFASLSGEGAARIEAAGYTGRLGAVTGGSTIARQAVDRFYRNLTNADADRLIAAGYTGRLGTSTGGSG